MHSNLPAADDVGAGGRGWPGVAPALRLLACLLGPLGAQAVAAMLLTITAATAAAALLAMPIRLLHVLLVLTALLTITAALLSLDVDYAAAAAAALLTPTPTLSAARQIDAKAAGKFVVVGNAPTFAAVGRAFADQKAAVRSSSSSSD